MAETTDDRLAALQAMVEQAKGVPMSASCMVNRGEALGLIEAARAALAAESEAQRAAADPSGLAAAKQEAARVLAEAQERAEAMVSETEVMRKASERAAELKRTSTAEAEALRREADLFVDSRIAALEAGFQKSLSQLQTMRTRLAARSSLDESDA